MPRKLDIGCGGRGCRRPGFAGIDIWPKPVDNPAPYYKLNFVTDKLPWGPNSMDEIIALHIIEHLTRPEGIILLQRAFELLKPGACMTVTCPDLRMLATAYVNHDEAFLRKKHLGADKEIWPGPTLADRLNWAIHEETHKWAYDIESLVQLAADAFAKDQTHEVTVSGDIKEYNFRPDHETGIQIRKGNKHGPQ